MYPVNNSIAQIYVVNYFKAVQNINNKKKHSPIHKCIASNKLMFV